MSFYSTLVAACTLILIAAGGLVTSTDSGLSVPDWPLSYGQFFPPMIGGIRFEHSHRMIAATVGLLTLALSVLFFLKEKRAWVKTLALAAVSMVLLQAILGALTVKHLLPPPVSVAHACLGQLFLCVLASLALFTSREWAMAGREHSVYAKSFQRLALTTTVFVFSQLVAGAVVRHTGKGLVIHIFLAFFIFIHAIFLNLKIARDGVLARLFLTPIAWLNVFLVAQLFLGFGSFFYKFVLEAAPMPRFWEIILTTAHQTTGAMIFASVVLLTLRSRRLLSAGKEGSYPSDFLMLMKPRVTLAALFTALVGYLLSQTGPDAPKLLHTLLGAFLIGGAANALNQYFERDADRKMKRTQNRPLPGGRLRPRGVLVFGLLFGFMGIAELLFFVNTLTGALGALTFFTYVFCYTPLKKKTTLNTFVGAIPGALPIALGWTAGRGEWTIETTALFLILFLWQLPHFFAIAWVHREDYRASGLKMLSSEDPDGSKTSLRILLYSALLLPAAWLPFRLGLSGALYLYLSFACGVMFLAYAVVLGKRRLEGARQFVSASIYYLFVVMILLVADKV